ncbi:unnamed protein product [Sphagnum tenellum]
MSGISTYQWNLERPRVSLEPKSRPKMTNPDQYRKDSLAPVKDCNTTQLVTNELCRQPQDELWRPPGDELRQPRHGELPHSGPRGDERCPQPLGDKLQEELITNMSISNPNAPGSLAAFPKITISAVSVARAMDPGHVPGNEASTAERTCTVTGMATFVQNLGTTNGNDPK